MTEEEFPQDVRVRLGRIAREWAQSHGDPFPGSIRMVRTTRAQASGFLNPGVTSEDVVCYFVVVEGSFVIPRSPRNSPQTGTWVALFIDPAYMVVDGHSLRPAEGIPARPLETLGTVCLL
ncbi:hypothetical protein [Streptomyces melanogenes]|uniref:hypothetical protein n=1 Tax=Streptomyces melanogenes TaxID=67326 RepID=UPI0037BD226E